MAKWRKFLLLSWKEQALWAQAAVLMMLIGVGLRCLGFRRVHGLLARGGSERATTLEPANLASLAQARQSARVIQAAARHGFYRAHCLPESLALWWLLRRQGILGELHIGVKVVGAGLEAHAWVEYQGYALNDTDDVEHRFVSLWSSRQLEIQA